MKLTAQCYEWLTFGCSFAYIEFADKESVETASALDGTLFRGRQLQVSRGFGMANFLLVDAIHFMVI